MSRSRNRAVAALQRWRSFEEARAAIDHRIARTAVVMAEASLADARDLAQNAQRRRARLLDAPVLDVDRYRAVGDIESDLWREVVHCELELSQARALADQSLQVHREAHASTEVARQRRTCLDRALDDHMEKAVSDRLAELRNASMRTPHD